MIGGRGGVVGGWRWGLWAVDLVAVMVEETVELNLSHHLHGVVERVNERNGPFVGLLMTYPTEEIALQVSGFFGPSSDFPLVQLADMLLHFSLSLTLSSYVSSCLIQLDG